MQANIGVVHIQMAIKELSLFDHFEKIKILWIGGHVHQDNQTSLYGLSLRKPNVDALNGAQGTITPTEVKHFPTNKNNKDLVKMFTKVKQWEWLARRQITLQAKR